MTNAEKTFTCTVKTDSQDIFESTGTLTTAISCPVPEESFGWPFWIQVAVAVGTVGAVFASIILSFIARKEASRLEFFRRELDGYEKMRRHLANVPYALRDAPEELRSLLREVDISGANWHVYARTKNEKVADTWYSLLQLLQNVSLTFETVRREGITLIPGHKAEQENFLKWVTENPKYDSTLNKNVGQFLQHVDMYYAGAKGKRATFMNSEALLRRLTKEYKIPIAYFETRTSYNKP